MSELLPESKKMIGVTILNGFDSATLMITASLLIYSRNYDFVNQFYFYIGTLCIIIYLLFIPESPKWLFLKEGGSSIKAINILNYIAWFNNSEYRVPSDA